MGKTISTLALILESKARALRRLPPGAGSSGSSSSSPASAIALGGKRPRGKAKAKAGADIAGTEVGGPTLVVVPLSVLSQWHREIQAFSAPQALAVLVYYGPDRPTDPHLLRSLDVVISTYGTLQSDYAAAVGPAASGARGGGGGGVMVAASSNADGSITGARSGLFGVRWGRVVLDEVR